MSLKQRHLKYLIKDEKMASKEYAAMARHAFTPAEKKMLLEMSGQEAHHKKNLEKILKDVKSRK